MKLTIYIALIILVLLITFLYNLNSKKRTFEMSLSNVLFIDFNKNNAIKVKNKQFLFIVVVSVILSIYSATLDNTWSHDRMVYQDIFVERIPEISNIRILFNKDYGMEKGYIFINMLVRKFTDNPFWLFFIITFIVSAINLYVLDKLTNKQIFCIIIIFTSFFFFDILFTLRQAIAVAFSNLAILSLLKEKKIKFWIYIIIAYLFHISALVSILFFIVRRLKSRNIYLCFGALIIIISVSYNLFFNFIFSNISLLEKYLKYMNSPSLSGGFLRILKGLPFYLLLPLAFKKYDKLIKINHNANIFVFCILMSSFSWMLAFNMKWFYRIGWYFLFPVICFIPTLVNTIKDKNLRLIYSCLIVLSFALVTFREIFLYSMG